MTMSRQLYQSVVMEENDDQIKCTERMTNEEVLQLIGEYRHIFKIMFSVPSRGSWIDTCTQVTLVHVPTCNIKSNRITYCIVKKRMK